MRDALCYCIRCGKARPEQAQFCGYCGTPFSEESIPSKIPNDVSRPFVSDGRSNEVGTAAPLPQAGGGRPATLVSPTTKGFLIFSYVYGLGWILGAIVTLLIGGVRISQAVLQYSLTSSPEVLGQIVGLSAGLLGLEAAMLYCAIRLLRRRCNKYVLGFLYAACVIDGLKTILHGLIPLEIILWFLLGLWPILYLRSRLKTVQSSTH